MMCHAGGDSSAYVPWCGRRCPLSQQWRLVILTSAVTRTEITVSALLATTMEIDVGASQNIVRRRFILTRADGFATPMGIGAIMSIPAGNAIRIGSSTTTTGTDKRNRPMRWAPVIAGPTC